MVEDMNLVLQGRSYPMYRSSLGPSRPEDLDCCSQLYPVDMSHVCVRSEVCMIHVPCMFALI